MSTSLRFFAALAATAACAFAVETRFWIQNEQADYEKATLEKLSLRSDGRLTLAPVFRELFDSSVPYLWALASDSRGNLYFGGGGPSASTAKLFRLEPNGKPEVWAELPGMEIHAIVTDRRGQVYAATSPDGKVYRIAAKDKHELFYDPQAKYIWALDINSKGDLFVATGDSGEVHRVTPDGKGSVFFRTEDTHARSLAIDDRDNLLIGTEPGGLILRVSPAGEGFVLFQSPKREVTAVAVAPDGTIYAAAVGNKPSTPGPVPSGLPLTIPPIPSAQIQAAGAQRAGTQPQPAPVKPLPVQPSPVSGGSEVYRIEKDNYPRKVWSHAQDIAYAISFDADGRAIIGTGNKGTIYRIDSDIHSTLLVNALPTQITAFARGPKGRIYAVTGNVGKVYQLGPELETQGTLESEPFDVGAFSYWGRVRLASQLNGGSLKFETRSGNLDRPHKNWSAWAPVDLAASARVQSPSARFLQFRLTLVAAPGSKSPDVGEIEVAYMPKNVGPVIEQIEITPPNYRFQTSSLTLTPSNTITLPALGQKKRAASTLKTDLGTSASLQYAKGHIGARWLSTDPNDDQMVYKVEIRGIGESEWKLLKDDLKEKHLSWDSITYPDGDYQVKVTAIDSPDNPPDQALTRELVSDVFTIDNTPPAITGLTASRSGMKVTARWRAKDARNVIEKAEYTISGGEWIVVEPTTRLTDSPEHEYTLTLENAPKGELTLAVRVTDEYDNQAVEKFVVK